jgi:hypothetical protein
MCCATRPLRWHELQAVLSMHLDDQVVLQYSEEDRLSPDVRQICGSLIRVVENSVYFAHETVPKYVVESEYMDRNMMGADVALYCMSYLSQSCFRLGNDEAAVDLSVNSGIYAFQDYAVATWEAHLTHMIENSSDAFRDYFRGAEYQLKTDIVLREFLLAYGGDMGINTATHEAQDMRSQGQSTLDFMFHNTLVPIWAHILRHRAQVIAKRHQVSIESLGKALENTRASIRGWSLEQEEAQTPLGEQYYGTNLFKCSRTTCDFFYDGFSTEEALKNHLNRHERPYACPYSSTCSSAPFGFASNRDKDRHVRIYHPDDSGAERAGLSSQTASPDGSDDRPNDERGPRHECTECGLRYTRRGALTSHMNSAHLGRRPYECSVCGRAFTRSNDMRRHERTIHRRR